MNIWLSESLGRAKEATAARFWSKFAEGHWQRTHASLFPMFLTPVFSTSRTNSACRTLIFRRGSFGPDSNRR